MVQTNPESPLSLSTPKVEAVNEFAVLSWNLEDNLNKQGVQDEILGSSFDVAIFPEAVAETEGVSAATIARFEAAGYDVHQTRYNDDDGRKDRHILVMAVRKGLAEYVLPVRLGQDTERKTGRTALMARFWNGAEVLGVHFDDRNEGRRLAQAASAVGLLGTLGKFVIAMGDMNATHFEGFWPALLRRSFAVSAAHALPAREPDGVGGKKLASWKFSDVRRYVETWLGDKGSLAQRLTQMVTGSTMRLFTNAGFADASPDRAATKVAFWGALRVQIDHIMHRGNVDVLQPTTVERTRASDHMRLVARFALRAPGVVSPVSDYAEVAGSKELVLSAR